MRFDLSMQLVALVTAGSMTITACGGSEQVKKPASGSAARLSAVSSTDDEGDLLEDAEDAGKGAGSSPAANRAKALDQLNQEINRAVAMKALAMETKVKLQSKIADIQAKRLSVNSDTGTAVGTGTAAVLCTALAITAGVLTAGVGAVIGASICAVGAGGAAIGATISATTSGAELEKQSKQLQAALKDIEATIVDLESKIGRQQSMVAQLIKESA